MNGATTRTPSTIYREKDDLPPLPIPPDSSGFPVAAAMPIESDSSRNSASTISGSSSSSSFHVKHGSHSTRQKRSHIDLRSPDKDTMRTKSSVRDLTLLKTIEERKELQRMVLSLNEQLRAERLRADDAENRLVEAAKTIKQLNDAKYQAIQDGNRHAEDLRLYKVQLQNAQVEIDKAQEVLRVLDERRYEAELEAARYRSAARKLKEARLIELAREEGRKQGIEEGLRTGRQWGFTNGHIMTLERTPPQSREDEESEEDGETVESGSTEEESDSDGYISVPARGTTATPGPSSAAKLPSASVPPPQPPPVTAMPVRVPPPPPPLATRPKIWHNDPTPHHPPVDIPPDNFIPTTDLTETIRIPPPHEFQNPAIMSPSNPAATFIGRDEPVMVPPPTSTAPQTPRSVTSRKSRARRSGRASSPDSNSTTLSQLDIISDAPHPKRREYWDHSPMSLIPEVPSPYSSPNPREIEGLERRPSVVSAAGSTSRQTPTRKPVAASSGYKQQPPQLPKYGVSNVDGPYTRPRSTSSSSTVTTVPNDPIAPPAAPSYNSPSATSSSAPEITVQPPSRSVSRSPSINSENPLGLSPSHASHAPLPSIGSAFGQPNVPQTMSSFGQPIVLQDSQLPPGFVPMNTMNMAKNSAFVPLGAHVTNGMPGGFDSPGASGPAVIPDPKLFDNTPISDTSDEDDNRTVSSGGSRETLTTPPLGKGKSKARSLKSVTSSALGTVKKASGVPLPPSTVAESPATSSSFLPKEDNSDMKSQTTTASKKGKGKKGKKR